MFFFIFRGLSHVFERFGLFMITYSIFLVVWIGVKLAYGVVLKKNSFFFSNIFFSV